MDPVNLSWFDWITVSAIFTILIAVISGLGAMLIRGVYREHNVTVEKLDKEIVDRENAISEEEERRQIADQKLADTLESITNKFQDHRVEEAEKQIAFLKRDDWIAENAENKARMKAFHERMDKVLEMLTAIRGDYVTKNDCRTMHEKLTSTFKGG